MIAQYRSLSDPLTPFDIILWVISAFLILFFVFFTLYKIKFKPKEITQLQKSNAITWAIAFLLLVISIILCLIWKYLIVDDLMSIIIDNIVVGLVNSAIIIKIIYIEYSINRYEFYKGYYFTIAVISLFTFTMIFTPSALRELGTFQVIYLILFSAGISIFPILFLYMAIKLKGKERFMAIRILIGAFLLGMGFMFQPQNMENYKDLLPFFDLIKKTHVTLCPIYVIIGTSLIFSSFKNNL